MVRQAAGRSARCRSMRAAISGSSRGLRRGDVSDASGWAAEPLGESGFAASSAAENQCQHRRGVRASIRRAAYASSESEKENERKQPVKRLISARSAFARSIALNLPEAGLLTRRSSLNRLSLPIPKNSGLLRRPLAAYSGGTVRDFHPLPFSLASTTSTSGSFQASTSFPAGQSLPPITLLECR